MKVLVTGATGFFGPEILAWLRTAGHDVAGAARRPDAAAGVVALDVTSAAACRAVIAAIRPEVVVHAAALAHVPHGRAESLNCRMINAGGTANLIDAAAAGGVRRFVFISSIAVYGDVDLPVPVDEDTALRPAGIYGVSKREGEEACLAHAARMDVVILRMATMYSESWFDNIRKRVRPLGRRVPVYVVLDSRSPRYSLCSRRNGAGVVRSAVDGDVAPGIYNVADDYRYTQRQILAAVERADGRGVKLRLPKAVSRRVWRMGRRFVPARRRQSLDALYWKFAEANVYSVGRLRAQGLDLPPDLIGSVP